MYVYACSKLRRHDMSQNFLYQNYHKYYKYPNNAVQTYLETFHKKYRKKFIKYSATALEQEKHRVC